MAKCPVSSFLYNNGTLCACDPGYYLALGSTECVLFSADSYPWRTENGDALASLFRSSFFNFNTVNKFTQSQALFLEITTVVVVLWIVACICLRFRPLRDGRSRWFRLRFMLSQLDAFFSDRHWIDNQKILVKRKTELGGMFSVASSIFFVGLSAALLFQIISKRSLEAQNMRPATVQDLEAFVNDLDFNITIVSSMSCAQLRGLGTLKTVIDSVDDRILPLIDFVNYTCYNTSTGPKVNFRCTHCVLNRDNYYIPWYFIDVPNSPATAVGFLFDLTAQSHKHISDLRGAVNASISRSPSTIRGSAENILHFHLVPRLIRYRHNLSLIQPFFHEYIPGSSYRTESELRSSLINPKDNMLNVTFHLKFLSDYIVMVDRENVTGPVTFLANLGGLYALSVALFLYILLQLEYRGKRFRHEDKKLRRLEAQQRARKNWDKLRRYVVYTWCSGSLNEERYKNYVQDLSSKTSDRLKRRFQKASERESSSSVIVGETSQRAESVAIKDSKNFEGSLPRISTRESLPSVPVMPSGELDVSSLQNYTRSLYEYNVRLREDFLAAQFILADIVKRLSPHSDICRGPSQ